MGLERVKNREMVREEKREKEGASVVNREIKLAKCTKFFLRCSDALVRIRKNLRKNRVPR